LSLPLVLDVSRVQAHRDRLGTHIRSSINEISRVLPKVAAVLTALDRVSATRIARNGLGELTSQSLAPAISPPASRIERAGYIQR
jgi:hypothetical protein